MKNDLICFSHLRWNFVYQRPQHLMSRAARDSRVFYFEEPVFTNLSDHLQVNIDPENRVIVVTPTLCNDPSACENIGGVSTDMRLSALVDQLIEQHDIEDFIAWYYAPMALAFTAHLSPKVIIYDCMDELSAFRFAPAELVAYEKQLLGNADVVFTGGYKLYQAKKAFHKNIHPFPSAIDKSFFFPARTKLAEPADQIEIPHPRLGFFGVIDERFDINLVREMADLKPKWEFIFIGPVVKIEESALPTNKNIHYLGMKDYKVLPQYISGWDLCIMPFAINASTEFISPTKTPEFLAAGKRVISTPIHDVIHPYGADGLVGIAGDAAGFIEIAEHALCHKQDNLWLGKVDQYLSTISWDKTWKDMAEQIECVMRKDSLNSGNSSGIKDNGQIQQEQSGQAIHNGVSRKTLKRA